MPLCLDADLAIQRKFPVRDTDTLKGATHNECNVFNGGIRVVKQIISQKCPLVLEVHCSFFVFSRDESGLLR